MKTNIYHKWITLIPLFIVGMSVVHLYGQTNGAIFEQGPVMNRARLVPMVATMNDGRVAIFGGREYNFVSCTYSDIYDPVSNSFTEVNMNAPHDGFGVAKMFDGRYYLSGGGYDLGIPAYANAEIFDPETNTFSAVASMNYARMQNTAVEVVDHLILIVGGWYDDYAAANPEVYDPGNNSYTTTAALNVPRAQALLLPTSDGGALVCGGWPSYYSDFITTVEYFDAENYTFSVFSNDLIPEDPGWRVWGLNRPVSEQQLSDGKYVLLAYRPAELPEEVEYGIIVFDPDNKTFELVASYHPTNYDFMTGGIYDIAVNPIDDLVYILSTEYASDSVVLAVTTVDVSNKITYFPENTYTLPSGEYLFPSLAYMPENGKVLLVGVSASPSDYFNGTNKSYLFKPEFTSGVEQEPLTAANITCYPNPAMHQFMISFTAQNAEQYAFRIFDMQGNTVYQIERIGNAGLNTWSFTDLGLPSGIYQYEIRGKGMNYTGRLILNK